MKKENKTTWTNIQFGTFEYESDHVIVFPEGLIGFEDLHDYILINDEETKPFIWLVSLEDQEISFPVLDPQGLVENYPKGYEGKEDCTILAIASLKDRPEESAINLRSPIIIENKTQRGKQIILDNESYDFRYLLFPSLDERAKG
jgi:flagellar assembly factor FliW